MQRIAVIAAFFCLLASSGFARAQNDERLGSFDVRERELIAPLLDQGSVALVEFAEGEALPAVVLAARIDAQPARIAEILDHPERYASFMDLLTSSTVTGRHEATVSFDWTWQTAVFELRGTNVLTRFDPPEGRPGSGYRFELRSTHGDLGEGRIAWRVLPDGEGRSLVLLSMRLDLRDANYLSRQMAAAARSVNRSANMSLAYLMLLGVEREAEQGRAPEAASTTPATFDVPSLLPLLERGDLVVFHGSTEGARRVSSIGRMHAPRDRIRDILVNPTVLGTTLIPGARASVVSSSDGAQVFDWELSIPLIGSSGRMSLSESARGVDVAGVSGSLGGGRWSIAMEPLGRDDIVLVTEGTFDPGDTSWLLRGITSSSPDFGHGLASACELMLVRAVRTLAHPR